MTYNNLDKLHIELTDQLWAALKRVNGKSLEDSLPVWETVRKFLKDNGVQGDPRKMLGVNTAVYDLPFGDNKMTLEKDICEYIQ